MLSVAILAGVFIGKTPLPFHTVAAVFANNIWNAGHVVDPVDAGIIWNCRLPRTLVAAGCGAGLALSGVVLQALVRNSLADPYLLGVSAGASTGAVAMTILGLGGGVIGISAGAFGGATLAFLIVAALARAAGGGSAQLVLAGIAGSQLFNALTSFFIAKSVNAEQARHHVLAARQSVRRALAGCGACGACVCPRLYGMRVAHASAGCVFIWHGFHLGLRRCCAPGAGSADRHDHTDDGGDGQPRRLYRLCPIGDPARHPICGRGAAWCADPGVCLGRRAVSDRCRHHLADVNTRSSRANRG